MTRGPQRRLSLRRGAPRHTGRLDSRDGDVANKRDWHGCDDVAVVLAIGRFEEGALAEAYRRHGGSVHALARRVLGEEGAAEEITQDVFVRLWEAPERFDPGRGTLRAFLLVQAHGRAVDRVRSDGARRDRNLREARLNARAGYDLEEEVSNYARGERLREAMSLLAEGERRAIELAYFGGHTYREVASLLDQPEGTVKSRIRSGLSRLQSSLSSWGEEDS